MELRQRRYNVLVVSAQPKFNESLETMLSKRLHYKYDVEMSVSAANRRLSEYSYDIVMVNAPLPDDDGVRLAIDRSSGSCAVLLFVRNEYYIHIFEKVCPYGVYTLPKPSAANIVVQAFDWLESSHERLARIEKKSQSFEEKMQEIRLVNRAKWLLITKDGISEEEAHHLIEKLAMDKCLTKGKIAEEIIASKA